MATQNENAPVFDEDMRSVRITELYKATLIKQGRHYFNSNKTYVKSDDGVDDVVETVSGGAYNPEALEAMHWRKLEQLVVSLGGSWTTREAAIEYVLNH